MPDCSYIFILDRPSHENVNGLCLQIKHPSSNDDVFIKAVFIKNEHVDAWPWYHKLSWRLNPEIQGMAFWSDLSMEEQNVWDN